MESAVMRSSCDSDLPTRAPGMTSDARALLVRVLMDGPGPLSSSFLYRLVPHDSIGLLSTGSLDGFSTVPGHETPYLWDVSPDGRWLAFTSSAEGPLQVYVLDRERTAPPFRISQGPGAVPRWAPTGEGLYYRNGQRFYWVPRRESGPDLFGPPQLFAEGNFLSVPGFSYAVSPDGFRLLALEAAGQRGTVTLDVIQGFGTRLAELLGES